MDYNIANAQHTQLMRQDAGIHTIIETISTAPTRLSFSTAKTRLMLSSSTMSQKRSTISWTVFSHMPYWKKTKILNEIILQEALEKRKLTLLQNPWIQGVPSGRISKGSKGKQVSLRWYRQQRLQASETVSHMHDWYPWVSQNGRQVPLRHRPFSKHSVPSGWGADAGHSELLPIDKWNECNIL